MAGKPLSWQDRVLAAAWAALEDAPPRDTAPLLRLVKDIEEGRADQSGAGSRMDQLEARRSRRKPSVS